MRSQQMQCAEHPHHRDQCAGDRESQLHDSEWANSGSQVNGIVTKKTMTDFAPSLMCRPSWQNR
jgi:hypothetical protein